MAGEAARERLLALTDADLDRAYRIAGLILGNAADAEDAAHDALQRAWRSARDLRDPGKFGAWLDRILINHCRDRIRRRARIRFIPLADDASALVDADPFRRVIERDEALRVLSRLDDNERVVVVLHYFADLTLEGVAARLGWPIGTVKSRLHRALDVARSAAIDDSQMEVNHG
jgi:RNA polymerase sigma factor (sigma-70 family)